MVFFFQKGFSQNVTVYLTLVGGSFTGEKWMNITTGINGTGTAIWSQGTSIGVSDGLITDEAISIPCGITYLKSLNKLKMASSVRNSRFLP